MRIAIVISAMSAGGAQRVVAKLTAAWADRGHEVSLITFEDPSASSFFDLHPRIAIQHLGILGHSRTAMGALWANIRRLRAIRSALQRARADVAIGVLDQTNVLTILAARSAGIPVIVIELTAAGVHSIGRGWNMLRRWTYRHAGQVVTDSDGASAQLTFVSADRRVCIRHFVDAPPARTRERVVTTACRLVAMKRVHWVIGAFAEAADESWRLVIMGDGPERSRLEELARLFGIDDRVVFTGEVSDVPVRLASAEVFALASEYEGSPVTLTEAMAAGCAVVSVDCPFGPGEIVRSGVDGLLVEQSQEALTGGLRRLLTDEPLRQRLRSGTADIRDRFSRNAILKRWDDILEAVSAQAVSRRRNSRS